MDKKNIIAVVGMCGSGKSVAVEALEEEGFNKVYFGGLMFEEAKKRGFKKEELEKAAADISLEVRAKYGKGAVAMLALDKIKEELNKGDVVIDGLYSWEELTILNKEFGNIKTVAIIADKNLRAKRLKERADRPYTYSQMDERDIREIENSSKGGPIAYADYFILNHQTKEYLQTKITEIANQIKKAN